MINFSAKLLESKHCTEAAGVSNRNSALSSQKVAFGETLARAGLDPNSSQVTFQVTASQLPVAGQNPAAALTGWNALIPPTEAVGAVTYNAPSDSTAHWYASNAADDAYWAKQPAAVQQLREISNEPERYQLASELAAQGYSIDVPVMVWGWDAGITTQLRESDGYTWVPSALQQPVSEAPGVNTAGLTPYNPANPPPGSILV